MDGRLVSPAERAALKTLEANQRALWGEVEPQRPPTAGPTLQEMIPEPYGRDTLPGPLTTAERLHLHAIEHLRRMESEPAYRREYEAKERASHERLARELPAMIAALAARIEPMLRPIRALFEGLAETIVRGAERYRLTAFLMVELERNLYAETLRRAIVAGHPRTAQAMDHYLSEYLGISPTPYTRRALYEILTRNRRWLEHVSARAVLRYIARSVWLRSGKLWKQDQGWSMVSKRARKTERRWQRRVRPPRAQDPLLRLIREEDQRSKVEALRWLAAHGTERDREILRLLTQGLKPAEVVASLGGGWSLWQAFQRKVRRVHEKIRT